MDLCQRCAGGARLHLLVILHKGTANNSAALNLAWRSEADGQEVLCVYTYVPLFTLRTVDLISLNQSAG